LVRDQMPTIHQELVAPRFAAEDGVIFQQQAVVPRACLAF
jgi:hypothetical protein